MNGRCERAVQFVSYRIHSRLSTSLSDISTVVMVVSSPAIRAIAELL